MLLNMREVRLLLQLLDYIEWIGDDNLFTFCEGLEERCKDLIAQEEMRENEQSEN